MWCLGWPLRIADALKKQKTRPSPPAITGAGVPDFMHHRKKRMGIARSLSFICCAIFMPVNHPEPTRKQHQPSRVHQKISETIQSPRRITSNHPEPTRTQHQPSRVHQEISETIQSPRRITSNHPEPTRTQHQPSRVHQEISETIQSPPGNDSDHPKPTKKLQQPSTTHQEITGIVRGPARNSSVFEATGFPE